MTGLSCPSPASTQSSRAPRRVSVLGATGSIGRSTADVLTQHAARFQVGALVAGSDAVALARMAIALRADVAVLNDAARYEELKSLLSGSGVRAAAGPAAVFEAAALDVDVVVAGIVGADGVRPTHAALAAGRTIALANKETLVCAGYPFMRDAARCGTTILPMDSEHNALAQALAGRSLSDVERLTLTASGGPFRTWDAARIDVAGPAEALAHPTWSMGAKISVDSATLMNKGLELIEAHHLFGVEAARLGVLVHPQSIIHGLVAFTDGVVVATMGAADMRIPISTCLDHPHRVDSGAARLDLANIGQLTFEQADRARFPALALAEAALAAGGAAPTVLNGANEAAVAAFLAGDIRCGDIARVVAQVCERALREGLIDEPPDIDTALAVHHIAMSYAGEAIGGLSNRSG